MEKQAQSTDIDWAHVRRAEVGLRFPRSPDPTDEDTDRLLAIMT